MHLHAELARLAPEQRGVLSLEVTDGTRVADVLQRFALPGPAAAHHRRRQLTAIAVRGSVKGLEIAKRLYEPLLKGPLSDKRLAEDEVRGIVMDYYVDQGWDPQSGAPLLGTLRALEMAEYADHAAGVVAAGVGAARIPPAVLGAEAGERHDE